MKETFKMMYFRFDFLIKKNTLQIKFNTKKTVEILFLDYFLIYCKTSNT
jgi:hypothetical protein